MAMASLGIETASGRGPNVTTGGAQEATSQETAVATEEAGGLM